MFAETEQRMWAASPKDPVPKLSDEEIDAKYESRSSRILTESNREQLPNFVEALKRPGWIELRPFYQRRQRWDDIRQSKLIESFIMNIPVPPLFFYESDFAKYEVMDGQQRITTIREFFIGDLKLRGLEQWPELNGRGYTRLPSAIKKGIDRRSISYAVLIAESAQDIDDQYAIRKMVFERLNTGGVDLSHQEIRNSLYHGDFNNLIIELSRNPLFRKAWNLPVYGPSEITNPSDSLLQNQFFAKMNDVECVLRFLALRNTDNYQRGMQGFLDLYMLKSKAFTHNDLNHLRNQFLATIELAYEIYGTLIFCPWTKSDRPDKSGWANRPQVAFADAVMVGLCRNLVASRELQSKKGDVVEATMRLFLDNPDGTFTGRGNTKSDVQERINIFDRMLKSLITSQDDV